MTNFNFVFKFGNLCFKGNFRSEKTHQIKLETVDDITDESVDENSDESEIDEKFSVEILTEKEKQKKSAKVFSAKKCRKKRKSPNFQVAENVVDVDEKRRKFVAQDSGPPFDCINCDASYDNYSTYRSVERRVAFFSLFCFQINYCIIHFECFYLLITSRSL
jgi:hypothetical protein